MALTDLLVRDVTVINPGTTTDAYGDTQPSWETATTATTKGWLGSRPSSSPTEDLHGRDATIRELLLTVPVGTLITARSRVQIDDVTYEVVGEPDHPWTPRGEHHIEAPLKVVAG